MTEVGLDRLASLPLDPKERCYYCQAVILWGEPYQIHPGYWAVFCSGCARKPDFRNGDASATELACIQLRQENRRLRAHLSRLLESEESLEQAASYLEEVASRDILPDHLRRVIELVEKAHNLLARAKEEVER